MKNERQIVEMLAEQLRSQTRWVATHRSPGASKKLKKELYDALGYHTILHPEIDLVLGLRDGRICAVEVKVFRRDKKRRIRSYYDGIGQALALHRYGFDAVALWFVFPEEAEAMMSTGPQAWHFVRNQLGLPLDFTYLHFDEAAGTFGVLQYDSDNGGHRLCSLNDIGVEFRRENPILTERVPSTIRRALVPWLRRQDKNLPDPADALRIFGRSGPTGPTGATGPAEM